MKRLFLMAILVLASLSVVFALAQATQPPKAEVPSAIYMAQGSMMGQGEGMMGMMQMMQHCVQHCTQMIEAMPQGKTGVGSGMMNGMGMMGSGMMSR